MIGGRLLEGHPARIVFAQEAARVGAGHIVHRNPELAVLFAAVMNPTMFGMRQTGRQLRLAQKSRPKLRIGGQIRRQHLQRILARQPWMRRQIHTAHPARAQHPHDRVSGEHLATHKRHGQIVNPLCGHLISFPAKGPEPVPHTPWHPASSHFVLGGRWPTTLRLTHTACRIVADFLRNSCGYCLVPVTCRKPRSVPRGEREVGRRPRVRTEAST